MRWLTLCLLIFASSVLMAQDDLEQFGQRAVDALKAESFARFEQLLLGSEDIPSLFQNLHNSPEWDVMVPADRNTAEDELRALQTALVEPDSDARRALRARFDSILVRGRNLYGFRWSTAGYVGVIEGTDANMLGLRVHNGLVVLFEAEGVQYRLAFGRLIHTGNGWRLGPDSLVEFVVQ